MLKWVGEFCAALAPFKCELAVEPWCVPKRPDLVDGPASWYGERNAIRVMVTALHKEWAWINLLPESLLEESGQLVGSNVKASIISYLSESN